MTIIRTSSFVGAIAIHGLLLASNPQPVNTVDLNSGSISADNIAVSISYQEPSAAPKPNVLDESPIKKPLTHSSKKVSKEKALVVKKSVSKPLPPKTVVKKPAAKSQPKPPPQPVVAAVTEKAVEQAPVSKFEDTLSVATPAVNTAKMQNANRGLHQNIVTKPLFASTPTPPRYPKIARKRGQQGTVWVDISLDSEGRQIRTEVFKSSGVRLLDRAALKAVRKWHFLAQRINNMAAASLVRIPVEFSLD